MPAKWRRDLLGCAAAAGSVLLFCLLLLQHDPHFFWTDDYQISILPVFDDVARSWSEGSWPLLSPYSWVCSNLAGEFQYGTFSVFVNAAVIVIWKFALTFSEQAAALSITHLIALSVGSYVLARGRKLPESLSVFVAIVASLSGWTICWGASDWFGALAAFAWLPWSWWALERAAVKRARLTRCLLPAPFIYLLITGGFPYTVLMLGLVTAWLVVRSVIAERDWLTPIRLSVGWLLGLGLSAPAWMALFEYSAGSRRSTEVFLPKQWIVPAASLPGLILPNWTVNWHLFEEMLVAHPAIELACGLAPVVLIIGGLVTLRRKFLRALSWDLALAVATLILCMIPSAGILRFSFRWLALLHLILALTAAETWRLWNDKAERRRRWSFSTPGAWSCIAVALTWITILALGLRPKGLGMLLPLVTLIASLAWWISDALLSREAAAWLPATVSFVALLTTYTTLDAHSTVARYWFADSLRSSEPLDPNRLYLSIYPAPQAYYRASSTGMAYGATTRPGSTSMFGRVHLINGYSPVGPTGVNNLFDFGTHGHINPPRISEVVLPQAGAGGLLEKLGIDGIIVAHESWLPQPLPDNWKLAFSDGEADVYHRTTALEHVRALIEPEFGGAQIKVIENSRQRVIADVTATDPTLPVRLIFSRPYFAGYSAYLNRRPVPVSSFRGLAPTVELPAGASGRIELVYRPHYVTVGGSVAVVTLLAMSGAWLFLRRR